MGSAYAAVKVVELDQEPALAANRARALNILTGLRTVPNTFIAGKNVGTSTMLTKVRDSGELRVLLREAGVRRIRQCGRRRRGRRHWGKKRYGRSRRGRRR